MYIHTYISITAKSDFSILINHYLSDYLSLTNSLLSLKLERLSYASASLLTDYFINCALWYLRLSTIWHRNTLLTVASRYPTQHVELVSGRHLATCWTSREHGPNSENVLSPSLVQRRGTHCPSA